MSAPGVATVLLYKVVARNEILVDKNEVIALCSGNRLVENSRFAKSQVFVPEVTKRQLFAITRDERAGRFVRTIVGYDDLIGWMALVFESPKGLFEPQWVVVGRDNNAYGEGVVRHEMVVPAVTPETFSGFQYPFQALLFVYLPGLGVGGTECLEEIAFPPQPAEIATPFTGGDVTEAQAVDIDQFKTPFTVHLVEEDIAGRVVQMEHSGLVYLCREAGKSADEVFFAADIAVAELIEIAAQGALDGDEVGLLQPAVAAEDIRYGVGGGDTRLPQTERIAVRPDGFRRTETIGNLLEQRRTFVAFDTKIQPRNRYQAYLVAFFVDDFTCP